MEKITYILKGKKELFEIVWKPFILNLEGVEISQVLVEKGNLESHNLERHNVI